MELEHISQEQLIELITRITLEVLEKNKSVARLPAQPALCECSGSDLTKCSSCGYCVVLRPDTRAIVDAGASRIATRPGITGVDTSLAHFIDHTLLKPDTTEDALRKLCDEAKKYHFASVCVNSGNVKLCAELLKNSDVKVAAVVGFPLGAMKTSVKAQETREVINDGAREIDMVINIGSLKSGEYKTVYEDIKAVVEAANGNVVKVILETGLLDANEKIIACALSKAAGAHFVKTSTGFGPKGATTEDIKLMRQIVGTQMGVKASGGIKDQETAKKMIEAGATRIGASASVAIVEGGKGTSTY